MRRHRLPLSSESGLIGVGTVIALGVAGILIYSAAAALGGNSALYGSVPVPATNVAVELPGSETSVFYAESVESSDTAPLTPPGDLTYLIAGEGETVRVDARGGKPEATDSGSARVIGAAFPQEEGTYLVTTSSAELAGRRRSRSGRARSVRSGPASPTSSTHSGARSGSWSRQCW